MLDSILKDCICGTVYYGTSCPTCGSCRTYPVGPVRIPFNQIGPLSLEKDDILLSLETQEEDANSPYETLHLVLLDALRQASEGKGKERHALEGEPFDKQKVCEITRRVGLGYPIGQAIKKAEESLRLGARGPDELLGAINYLAAAVIVMRERLARGEPLDED